MKSKLKQLWTDYKSTRTWWLWTYSQTNLIWNQKYRQCGQKHRKTVAQSTLRKIQISAGPLWHFDYYVSNWLSLVKPKWAQISQQTHPCSYFQSCFLPRPKCSDNLESYISGFSKGAQLLNKNLSLDVQLLPLLLSAKFLSLESWKWKYSTCHISTFVYERESHYVIQTVIFHMQSLIPQICEPHW